MNNFKQVLVLENDLEQNGVPSWLKREIESINLPTEYWYDFRMTLYRYKQLSMERFLNLSEDTLLLSAPSFVGYDNSFESYVHLFYQLKELNKSVNLAIVFPEGFFMYLLHYLSDEDNLSKKEQRHRILKDILDFHNIYEIEFLGDNVQKITYENLVSFYYERHRQKREQVIIKETNEIVDVVYVSYPKSNNFDDIRITIINPLDETERNVDYNIHQIEKIIKYEDII